MRISRFPRLAMVIFCFLAAILDFSACAGGRGSTKVAPSPDIEARLAEAQALVQRGAYVPFKKAAAVYEALYADREAKARVAYPYVRNLILLISRERQIGIHFSPTMEKALAVIRENPRIQALQPLVDLADAIRSPNSRGIQTDIKIVSVRAMMEDTAKLRPDLRIKAAAEDFYDYLYLLSYAPVGYTEDKEDFSVFYAAFPDSPLIKYLNALRPMKENPDLLAALVAADPEFYEAYFSLGELALAERRLLGAETNFLKAAEGLPDSPQVAIYLASIYTATEEFEKSLEHYDRTLALSPEYRDALLGKAICLSTLGRSDEAIRVLGRMVALGNWLMGEAHYWLAWNYHALKDNEMAFQYIEGSKGRLPTNSEVFSLAGTIAWERRDPVQAEKNFKEALQHNAANTEALFGLARVMEGLERWPEGAGYYEQAVQAVGRNAAAVLEKIEQIKTAVLSEDRRANMLAKKEQQLRVLDATRALASYNAAVDWFNAGSKARALTLAEQAASHPQYKERAAELIARIKS